MDEYEVIITDHALYAIRNIRNYIANTLNNPTAALNHVKVFQEEINKLSFMPERIKLTSEQPWGREGIRRFQVKNYYVYFWINYQEHQVYVTDVIFAGRNQKEQLSKMPKK